ncbi:transcriptional regulator [Candidatus Saccharibacteria bacterium]|nr:transcriptional regulator [Candidatus Saccharibacteria bacterium]
MSEEIPYPKGKPMYLIEDVDDKNLLKEIIIKTKEGLVNRER